MLDALPELSSDLWTRIFQHLKPAVAKLGDANLSLENVAADVCAFQSLQQVSVADHWKHYAVGLLRDTLAGPKGCAACSAYTLQVCKQFRDIFLSNCDWYALLCLPDRLSKSSSASLRLWSTRHRSKVVDLRLSPDGLSEVTGTIGPMGPSLGADNSLYFSSTDCLLTAFTALRTCSLDQIIIHSHTGLDLGIMQSLHHLNNLELKNGYSYNLNRLKHITMLVLDKADVTASKDCSFTSKLQCLDLKRSMLSGLHFDGITACQQLRFFRCIFSTFMALADIDVLGTADGFFNIPSAMSQLVALEQLQLAMASSVSLLGDGVVDLQWLSSMTNLTKLFISPSDVCKFPSSSSNLPKLQEWWFACAIGTSKVLKADWQVYQSLEQVHFVGCVRLDAHALHRLASIEAMSEICVHLYAYELHEDPESLEHYTVMAERFMRRSPWIKFSVKHLPSHPVFFSHSIASFEPLG